MPEPELQALTVTQFNEAVSSILSESLPYSLIEGEVTGLKIRQNKWISFDLKDSASILPCFGQRSPVRLFAATHSSSMAMSGYSG